jgi:hypothetical protein
VIQCEAREHFCTNPVYSPEVTQLLSFLLDERVYAGDRRSTGQALSFAQKLFPRCEMRLDSVVVRELYLVVGRRIQNREP